MSEIAERLSLVHSQVERAAASAGRDPARVQLLAISKTFPASRVIEALDAGIRSFGENRVQEASLKLPEVASASERTPEWHFVGPLQRNKARQAVALFDMIHSLDRPELATELERAATALERRLKVFLQVNIDGEAQKSGVRVEETAALLSEIARLPHLEVIGLMALPERRESAEAMRPAFARLRTLLEELKLRHPDGDCLRELSMGMSADFEVAVQEGATWIRLGGAIFGERKKM